MAGAERLALRRAVAADLDATWRFRRLEEVTRWITAAPSTRADYRTHSRPPAGSPRPWWWSPTAGWSAT